MILQITAPHFCAGGTLRLHHLHDLRVCGSQLAPIIRYMAGWQFDRVAIYCKAKGWNLQKLEDAR